MAGTLAPTARAQFFDNDGAPVAGGKLYTYSSGTSTALTAYSDATLETAHTNPIILDSAGRATIFLGPSSYKFQLHDADDVLLWSVDPVQPLAPYSVDLDIDGVAGEALTAGQCVYMGTGAGGTTAGRWYRTDADATGSSSLAPMVGLVTTALAEGATGTIRLQGRMTGLSGLSAGATYYVSATAGAITSSAPANVRLVGVADSTTSLILFSAAVGNTVAVDSIGFTPLASAGASGAIVATINATSEGIRIAGNRITLDGTVSFSSGYDPSLKVASGGAAADVNSGSTTITGSKITAGTITATQISSGTITATQIAAGTITSDKLSVSTLSAVAADLGTVTAGTISGTTINAGSAGSTKLSASGLQLDPSTAGSSDSPREIGWKNLNAGGFAYLQAYESSSRRSLILENTTDATHYPQIALYAHGSTSGRHSSLVVTGASDSVSASLTLNTPGEVVFTGSGSLGSSSPSVIRPDGGTAPNLGTSTYKFGIPYFTLSSATSAIVAVATKADGALYYVPGYSGTVAGVTFVGGIAVSGP